LDNVLVAFFLQFLEHLKLVPERNFLLSFKNAEDGLIYRLDFVCGLSMVAVQIIRELIVRVLANPRVGVTLGQETLDCLSSVFGQVSHCLLLSRLSLQVGLGLELVGGDVRHREVVSEVTFGGVDT